MQFKPRTEKEIQEENLRPAGVYSFEIVDAKDETSKKGNDMIKLSVRLYNTEGDDCGVISDYLLESLAYKLRHAAVACGLEEKYVGGNITADDFIGKMGDLKLSIRKDKTGQYPDQNSIQDYVVKKDGEVADGPPPGHPAAASLDDSIPF